MKKGLKFTVGIPIFLLRWINGFIMRIPLTYLILMAVYTIGYYILKDGLWSAEMDVALYLTATFLISGVWSLAYTLSKPPVTKKVYTSKSYKVWAFAGRILCAVLLVYLLKTSAQSKITSVVLSYCILELIINGVIVLITSKTTGEIYQKIRGNTAHRTAKPTARKTSYSSSTVHMNGEEGEKEVDYNLKWLKSEGYAIIEKQYNEIDDREEIRLRCRKVSNETQEFDHIVIGKNGVFNIETKTYMGTIFFDEQGQWKRFDKYGKKVVEKNPLAQIDRHHAVLKGILGEKYPIVDVLCIAHPDAELKVSPNAPVAVVKADMLNRFITSYKSDIELEKEEIEMAEVLIGKSRVMVYAPNKER